MKVGHKYKIFEANLVWLKKNDCINDCIRYETLKKIWLITFRVENSFLSIIIAYHNINTLGML